MKKLNICIILITLLFAGCRTQYEYKENVAGVKFIAENGAIIFEYDKPCYFESQTANHYFDVIYRDENGNLVNQEIRRGEGVTIIKKRLHLPEGMNDRTR